MTDKEKIRAEIERLKQEELSKKGNCKRSGLTRIVHHIGAYNELLSFISSLPEEPVSEDLEEVSKRNKILRATGHSSEKAFVRYICYDEDS